MNNYRAMLALDRWIAGLRQQYSKVAPLPGRVSVGAADVDVAMRIVIAETYQTAIRSGKLPKEAYEAAAAAGASFVTKWNSAGCKARMPIKGHYEYHYHDRCGENLAMDLHRQFLAWCRDTEVAGG